MYTQAKERKKKKKHAHCFFEPVPQEGKIIPYIIRKLTLNRLLTACNCWKNKIHASCIGITNLFLGYFRFEVCFFFIPSQVEDEWEMRIKYLASRHATYSIKPRSNQNEMKIFLIVIRFRNRRTYYILNTQRVRVIYKYHTCTYVPCVVHLLDTYNHECLAVSAKNI